MLEVVLYVSAFVALESQEGLKLFYTVSKRRKIYKLESQEGLKQGLDNRMAGRRVGAQHLESQEGLKHAEHLHCFCVLRIVHS